jgi:hypothetical protein
MHKIPPGVTIWKLNDLIDSTNNVRFEDSNGNWQPARPLGCDGIVYRLKAAWLVLTCKADAVIWPRDDK